MKRVAAIVIALAACKGGDKAGPAAKATAGSAAGSSSVVATTDARPDPKSTPNVAAKKPEVPHTTAAQKAAYREHLKAAYALQKTKKWPEAVAEFEAALVAIPGEQRALAELGWSAQNAGDLAKARTADEQAVAAAVDTKVKASALFNLGSVQDKGGDKAAALASYTQSIALRPNKTVEAAAAALQAAAAASPPAEQGCAPGKKPCDCILPSMIPGLELGPTCAEDPDAVAGDYHTWTAQSAHGSWTFLFDAQNRFVRELSYWWNHGVNAEGTNLQTLQRRKLAGGREILWIEQTSSNEAEGNEGASGEISVTRTSSQTSVTICLVGDAATKTTCPVENLPKETGYRVITDDGKVMTDDATELSVDLADDGTLTVAVVKGKPDASLIGARKLW